MQMCADVIGRDIAIVRSEQCCALGAAIFAAVAAGVHADSQTAQQVMASPICQIYQPNMATKPRRTQRYSAYRELGHHIEQIEEFHLSQERHHG